MATRRYGFVDVCMHARKCHRVHVCVILYRCLGIYGLHKSTGCVNVLNYV